MEDLAEKIYLGGEISIEELGNMALQAGAPLSARPSYNEISAWVSRYHGIRRSLSVSQIQALVAYAFTGRTTPYIESLLAPVSDASTSLESAVLIPKPAPAPGDAAGPVVACASTAPDLSELREQIHQRDRECAVLRERIASLEEELARLKGAMADKSFGDGFFIEPDVMKKMEEENLHLREMSEATYNDLVRVWFKLVRDRIRDKEIRYGE